MINRTRVFIIDDEPVIRDGLTKILNNESDMIVVGGANCPEAMDDVMNLQPDIILIDIIMPNITGLQAMPLIKEKLPNSKLLMLTVSDNQDDLFSALKLGAQGYLLKSSSVDQIIDGVRRVASGETVLSPKMAGKLAAEIRFKTDERKLSLRENQILELIREGLTNVEIAKRLSVEESTVKTHIHHLLGKLRVKNRTEAIFFARRHLL